MPLTVEQFMNWLQKQIDAGKLSPNAQMKTFNEDEDYGYDDQKNPMSLGRFSIQKNEYFDEHGNSMNVSNTSEDELLFHLE